MTRNNLEKRAQRDGIVTVLTVLGLGMSFAVGSSLALRAGPTHAESLAEAQEKKEEWQSRYRGLRLQQARLEKTIDLATKEYADANRRSYRRSGVRHFHRANAQLAEKELEKIRVELEQIYDDARVEGIPLIWLYEVEDEKIDSSQVTGLGDYANESGFLGSVDTDDDREETESEGSENAGRNPIHLRDETPPASPDDDSDDVKFDYDTWRKDRAEYEGRAWEQ